MVSSRLDSRRAFRVMAAQEHSRTPSCPSEQSSVHRMRALGSIYLVAVTRLAGNFEKLVKPLSWSLKQTDWDTRERLLGTLPRLVQVTRDEEEALRTLSVLRAAGQGATACDTAAVQFSSELVSLRGYRVTDAGVLGYEPGGNPTEIRREDVLCLLPAIHEGYVLYVFRNSGARPCILRETVPGYVVAPPGQRGPRPEFSAQVHELRRVFGHAIYDERLLGMDLSSQRARLQEGDDPVAPAARLSEPQRPSGTLHRSPEPRPRPRALQSATSDGGLIPPFEDEFVAHRVTTDVMAHLTALSYARSYF